MGRTTVGWRKKRNFYLYFQVPWKIPLKNLLKALLLIVLISECQKPNQQEEKETILQTKIAEGMVVGQFYPNNVLKDIYQINDQGLKEGNSFSYHKDGALANTTSWEKGQKNGKEIIFYPSGEVKEKNFFQKGILEGNSYRFKNGELTSHQINRQGNTWYEGIYSGPEKHLDKIYPLIIEEFF